MWNAVKGSVPRVVSGLAITAVAVAAGWISFGHIYELSLRLHQGTVAARLMPVGIDGLILVGSMVLLQAEPGERWLGWLGIGPGVAISLFANVESGIRYGWLAAVWAGVPAVSFALASFILERWIKQQAGKVTATEAAETAEVVTETKTVADAESEPEPESVPPQDIPGSETMPETGTVASVLRRGTSAAEPVGESSTKVQAAELPQDGPASDRVTGAPWKRTRVTPLDAEAAFASMLSECRVPSLRHIRRELPVGEPKAKALKAHLETVVIQRQGRAHASSAHAG